jgi:hypothetical protein
MNKNNLEGWLFTYNAFTNEWMAADRDHYQELFNGGDNVIKSSKLHTLEELIMKYETIKEIKNNVK